MPKYFQEKNDARMEAFMASMDVKLRTGKATRSSCPFCGAVFVADATNVQEEPPYGVGISFHWLKPAPKNCGNCKFWDNSFNAHLPEEEQGGACYAPVFGGDPSECPVTPINFSCAAYEVKPA